MSEKKKFSWTPQQDTAINERNKTLLVSAAAGSGKTATLTERIIRRITIDGADISNMLIVTFTRASASDLRTKIFKAISDALAIAPDKESIAKLSSQLTKLNNAKICTIDSFCYDLIKEHFSDAEVSPTFRIIDDSEYALIAKRIMNDVIDEFYENEDSFPIFTECFASVRAQNSLCDVFLSIHSALATTTEGIEFLKNCAEQTLENSKKDLMHTAYGELFRAEAKTLFEYCVNALDYAVSEAERDAFIQSKYGDMLSSDLAFHQSILLMLKDESTTFFDIKDALDSFKPMRMGIIRANDVTEKSLELKNLRDAVKEKRKGFHSKYFESSKETIERAMLESASHTLMLYKLLKAFETKMNEQKKRLDFLTFKDISRKAYSLLMKNGEPTETAKKLALEFSDIYIDEYQDVDPLQDAIFKSISTPTNRFMVGDIKQSIYKFRGAEPTLFSSLRNGFPKISSSAGSDSATIFMSNNFRCDDGVIAFTNLVCGNIFRTAGGCVSYEDGDDLVYTKDEVTDKFLHEKVKVRVISIPSASKKKPESLDENANEAKENEIEIPDYSLDEWESEYIADEIKYLIENEEKASNAETKPADKKIRPGDIAVLFRNKRMSIYLSSALRRRGIKTAEADSTQYFENDDVLLMLCILNTIDNPERDIYTAGTLRSPLFDFTADDLLVIRRSYGEPCSLYGGVLAYMQSNDDPLAKKCRDFYDTLIYWQESASSLSIDRFLLLLFNTEKFIASGILSSQTDNGEGGNVLLLYDYARSFQGNGFKGLYEFIEYVNSLIKEGQSFASASKRGDDDRVSLMTIHKSKGLEFPVCFLASAGKSFSTQDSRKSLSLCYPYGIAMEFADESGFAKVKTPMHDLLNAKIYKEGVEEEIRVLYVALTRARERLYVVGTARETEDELNAKAFYDSKFINEYTVFNECTTYMDWILLSLYGKEHNFVDLKFLTPADITLAIEEHEKASTIHTINEELYEKLSRSFAFEYQYSELAKVPSKLSVSRLYPDVLDENDTSFELFLEKNAEIPEFFADKTKEPTAAERGTATHLFLQFCNFENLAIHGVRDEITRLCEQRYLPESAKDMIYSDELERFLDSELINEILSAKRIIREQRFNVSFPSERFTKNPALIEKMNGESLAVQGVIDLILITRDDKIKLYDYKTDRLTSNELESYESAKKKLTEKHAEQLSYYAMACKEMFGRLCDSVQIYSTHSAKLYDIEVADINEII